MFALVIVFNLSALAFAVLCHRYLKREAGFDPVVARRIIRGEPSVSEVTIEREDVARGRYLHRKLMAERLTATTS